MYLVNRRYIEEGYKTSLVLKFAGLRKSIYYYGAAADKRVKSVSLRTGRPTLDIDFVLITENM